MLLFYSNSVDVTQYIEMNSLSISEELNNRSNTASFRANQNKIGAGANVQIYEYVYLTSQASSGQATLNVSNTHQNTNKYSAGDIILLNIGSTTTKATILSVDHSAKTITLASNLTSTLPLNTKCGRLIYSGVCIRQPEEEIGYTGTFSYNVECADLTALYNRKVVVENYLNVYAREILGLALYEFVASDSEVNLDKFDTAWTESGTAYSMTQDTVIKVQGAYSMKTGATAGTAKWTKTITSANLSTQTEVRLWHRCEADYGQYLTGLKYRIGTDASNYYEWSTSFVGEENEDCWHYDSFEIANATIVGSPNLSAIVWLQIEATASNTISNDKLHFDHTFASKNGFKMPYTIRGDIKFEDIRYQYKKMSDVTEDLAKTQGLFWYIDYERNLHFFQKESKDAPFSLTDSSQNFSNLTVDVDMAQIKNRQTVRGGEAPEEVLYSQFKVCDGIEKSWRLDYKYKDLSVYIDTGSGYVSKTVGIENVTDETTVDFVANFNEKTLRTASIATPTAGHKIKMEYYPYKSIRVRAKDQDSINAMKLLTGGDGIYDGSVITDISIKTWQLARQRAQAEIDTYSNPIITASFNTAIDGLQAGQKIRITDSSRNLDQDFLIQRLERSSLQDDYYTYSATCATSLLGIVEFFQWLLKQGSTLTVDVNEQVDIVENLDETITIGDTYSYDIDNKLHTIGTKQKTSFDFMHETGSRTTSGRLKGTTNTNWKAVFASGSTGTVQFTTSRHNNNKGLKITATTNGSSKYIKAQLSTRLGIKGNTQYDFSAWTEQLTALSGSNGLCLKLVEYANLTGGSALQTTILINNSNSVHDFERTKTTLTTNASTNYCDIEIYINEATGIVSICDIILEDKTIDTQTNPTILDYCEAI